MSNDSTTRMMPEDQRRVDRKEALDRLVRHLAGVGERQARERLRRFHFLGALTSKEMIAVWGAMRQLPGCKYTMWQ